MADDDDTKATPQLLSSSAPRLASKFFGKSIIPLLASGAGAFTGASSLPQMGQAADLSSLPQEVKTAFAQMKESEEKEDPYALRDAVKLLSEYPGLDELTFDLQAREVRLGYSSDG